MNFVICKLPKAGLGNQLFPLMKAYCFAELNQLPVVVTNYHQLKIGPWLRGEKTKRNYHGFFSFEKSIVGDLWDQKNIWLNSNFELREEPEIKKVEQPANKKFLFSEIPHWEDYFDGLRQNRELAISLFWKMLSPVVLEQLKLIESPCIGVHIRMGDFRKLKRGENFSMVGMVRTPEMYFIEMINKIRAIHGTALRVSVFTDGYRNEFEKLFELENIELVEGNSDMVDLLLLSKSKIIVTSAGSTFSYWAAFLSNALVIKHPDHIHTLIRPVNCNLVEMECDKNNKRLTQLIHSI